MLKNISKTLLFLLLIIFYIPVIVIVLLSFSNSISLNSFAFGLNGFRDFISNHFFTNSIWNSITIGIMSSCISTFLAFFLVIRFKKKPIQQKKFFLSILFVPFVNSDLLNGLSLFVIFLFISLKLGFITFLFSHVVLTLPYAIIILLPKINYVKNSYIESSYSLQANYFQTLYHIIFKMMIPTLIIAFFVCFINSFDDFIFSFLNSGKYTNISLYIYTITDIHLSFFVFATIILFISFAGIICFFSIFKIIENKKANIISTFYLNYKNLLMNSTLVKKVNNTIKIINIKVLLFFLIIFLFISGSILYFVFSSINSISVLLYNGYLSSKSIDDFSKSNHTKVLENFANTDQQIIVKSQRTNYDLLQASEWYSYSIKNSLYKYTSQDINLFTNTYNKLSNTNFTFKQIFSKFINKNLSNYDNSIFNYFLPYVSYDGRALINKNNYIENNKYKNNYYYQIYYNSINNKIVSLMNEPNLLAFLGINIYLTINNIKVNDENFLTKQNIVNGFKYINIMLQHHNTTLCTDFAPESFYIKNNFSIIYTANYNLAYWFSLYKHHNKQGYYEYPEYKIAIPSNFSTTKSYLVNDGFIIKKTTSPTIIKKLITFMAYQYCNKNVLYNLKDNGVTIDTSFVENYFTFDKHPQYYLNSEKNNMILQPLEVKNPFFIFNNNNQHEIINDYNFLNK